MPRPLPAIIIDSREQAPYSFDGYSTKVAKLGTGDYSIEGYESKIAVERKSKEDAYGCVGASRDRFIRCLGRLGMLERAAIVIECSLTEFTYPPPRTLIDQRMAIGSFISWSCIYRIPVFWCDSRTYAERITVRYLMSYLKHLGRAHDD